MMINSSQFVPGAYELGQALRRRVWHPLRPIMEIFYFFSLTAAVLVFFLFATQPYLHQIYLSYLEGLKDSTGTQIASNIEIFLAGAMGLALISGALYEAHYWLSTMRINVVYSSISDPESGSALRGLHRIAAIGLALVPWLAVVAGLFNAKLYLVNRSNQLQEAGIDPDTMSYLQTPGTFAIVIPRRGRSWAGAFFPLR